MDARISFSTHHAIAHRSIWPTFRTVASMFSETIRQRQILSCSLLALVSFTLS
jgi:hypothetical protein